MNTRMMVDGLIYRPRRWYEKRPTRKAVLFLLGFAVGWFLTYPALRFLLTVFT